MLGLFGRWQVVREGQAGLLYREGVFLRVLPPGRHRVRRRETLVPVVTGRQMVVVGGQEVMSSDGFLPRLSAVAEFTVIDPHLAATWNDGAYRVVVELELQIALRGIAASRTAEALSQAARATLDGELLALVRFGCSAAGLQMEAVRLRDMILPADFRRLLTGVEKARREGQAALERAHAEQAALRALANAARMLRNNPELQNLRLLQAVGGGGAPVTIVLGTPAGIVPLREGPTEGAFTVS